MALESYVFKDFSGGWNTRDGPFQLADNESPNLRNVSLTTHGALKKRAGLTRFDSSGFPGAKRAEHLRAWYPGTSRFLMCSIDGDIYSSDVAGALTSRVDGTAGAHWMMEDMQDINGTQFLWAVNGVDAPRRISSGFVVTNWTAPVDTDTDYHIIRVWRNRMVAVKKNTNRLYISAIGNPESFGTNDFIDVKASDDDNDWITWMEVLGDNLVVFKKQSVWSLYAEPPAPAIRQLGGPGAENRFQSCIVSGRCYFWNRTGVYSTDGDSEPREETAQISNYIRDNLNQARHDQVRLYAGRDRRIFVSICTSSATENNELLEGLSFAPRQDGSIPWVRHKPAYGLYGMATFRSGNVDKFVAGTANDNVLVNVFEGLTDRGIGIDSLWQVSWNSITEPSEAFERLRRVNVLMEGELTLYVYRDFDPAIKFSKFLSVHAGNDPFWNDPGGIGTWDSGLDTWDSPPAAALTKARPESRARYHSFALGDISSLTSWTVYSVELKVRGGKEH